MSFFGSAQTNIPPVVKNILIINVLVFVASWLSAGLGNFMTTHLALYSVKSELFSPVQLITHMFMHANFYHIFFNMFGVFMFGKILEQVWGGKRMLIFYLITGMGAAVIHLTVNYFQMHNLIQMAQAFNNTPDYTLFNEIVQKYVPGNISAELTNFMQEWFYKTDDPSFIPTAREYVQAIIHLNLNVPMVGASGAVFGLLIAFAMMFPDVELMLLFLPVPIKAKYFVPFYALAELFFGVANFKGDNIAHFAHLGGALFGFILVKWWKRNQFRIY